MSEWKHSWSYPFILVVRFEASEGEKPERIVTLGQDCLRCNARRNPVSGAFHSWGTNARATCHNPTQTEKELVAERARYERHVKLLEDLEVALKAMKDDGWEVLPRWAEKQRGGTGGSANRELAI